VTGELQIESGAKVTLSGKAATLDFDITDRTTADAALYNNYGLITGAANAIHTITVSSTQTAGSYRLADNAAAFAATVTVKDETKTLGTLTVDGDSLCADLKNFSLTLDEGALALNVADLVIIADKYTVKAGETLDMAAVVDGGKLIVSSGGSATNIELAGGVLYTMAVSPDTLVQAWSNGKLVTNNSGGYLSGYTHNPGDGDTAGTLHIYSGGTATEIVGSNSWIRVSEGGLLSGADIVATGRLGVHGGSALDVTVNDSSYLYLVVTPDAKMDIDFGGHRITASDGVMHGFVGGNGTSNTMAQILAGASAIDNSAGKLTNIMVSSGFVSNTVLSASGNPTKVTEKARMDIRYGGSAFDTFIYEGGSMSVSNGQSFIGNTHVYSGGILTLATLSKTEDPATARFRTSDTYITTGGTMTVSSGGIITGELQIESGARVTVKSGATLDFDLTNRATTDAALCNDYSLIGGAADAAYTVTVSASQAKGTYRLADNAASFAATVTVRTANETLGVLSVGESITVNDTRYGLALRDDALSFKIAEVSSGMIIGGKYTLSSGMVLEDATVEPGGVLSALAGGTATNLTVEDGASLHMAVAPDTVVQGTSAGVPFVNSDGYLSGYVHEPTSITRIAISSGGTAVDVTCVEGWINVSAGGLLSSSYVSSTGRLGLNGGDALDVTVEAGAQFFVTVAEGTNLDITSGGKKIVATDGVIDGISADGSASAWYYITSGGSAINTVGNNKMWLAVSAGYASNTILRASGNPTGTSRARLDLRSGGVTEATFISAGGSMSVSNGQSIASDTHIYQSGILDLTGKAAAEGADMHPYAKDTYVHSGGTMLIKQSTVVTGELQIESGAKVTLSGKAATLDFDVTDRTTADAALYNNYSLISGAANAIHTVTVSSTQAEGDYRLASGAAAFAATVTMKDETAELGTLEIGASLVNGNTGYVLVKNDDALSLSVAEIAEAATAGTLDNATILANGDRAAVWGANTLLTSGSVFLAGNMTSGTAYLELDGYNGGTGTILYGAQGSSFANGKVDIQARSGSIRNLAAGADKGGTVAAVNLTLTGAELDGTGYAGGFGSVTGEVRTQITTGTIKKDFYAGALANKLTNATSVGNVSMTVDGGTFSGNIYGASAVKTDTTVGNGTRHTAGDVTLTVTGGETAKGAQACIFAGGYATGNATGTVYTVDSVTATISGGSWGTAAGGRGVFGGIMASGVEAQVIGDVNITISGGTMGNVYGGGWAQKNGVSAVGDVSINIDGGTVANVFGGGSHSTSGGTTEAGDITITVSGGNITGDIYARGQLDGDVAESAKVIFTGSADFGCGVYGYSCVGGEASDATLSFTGYTGEFAGAIGGFDGITLNGAAAMTLATAAEDVSNSNWMFDVSERSIGLAGTAMVDWDDADFAGDTIKLNLTTGSTSEWTLVDGAANTQYGEFEVLADGISQGVVALDQKIADGEFAGWGFALEDTLLKFKQLA